MTNNDVLRRLRYILDYGDQKMISTFGLGGKVVTREELSRWLKKDEDPDFAVCKDELLSIFLNGLIIEKRGQKGDGVPEPERKISNNIVLRKVMIAFSLKTDDVLELLKQAEFEISKHELSAFFRKPDHKNFRLCKAQVLRKFLTALQTKLR